MKISDLNLTNDAKFLVSSMYKIYIEQRKNKIDKRVARLFGDISDIQKIMSQWSPDDVLDTCFELRDKGLINGTPGNNSLFYISLTTDAIALLEVSFKDKADDVLDYIVKIKSLIPFI